MAAMKNMTMGEMRLLFIHTRVQYLCLNYLDEENIDEFKYKLLCDYCEMILDMSGGKRGNELEVTPSCKTLFGQCNDVGWLCRTRQRLINMTHIHWESEGQMTTKKIYNMILMHILNNQQPKDAVYNTEHFSLELTKKMPHLVKTTQLAEFLIYSNYIPFQLTEGIFPVPPIGEEFTDAHVPPMKSKIKYENKYNETIEKEEYGWTQPGWKEELTKSCKKSKYWIKSSMKHWMKFFMPYTNFLLQLMLVSIVFGSNTKSQEKLSTVLAFPSYTH